MRNIFFSAILLAAFSMTALGASRALIVGINKYPNLDPRYQLQGCVNDAQAYQTLLGQRFNMNPEEVVFVLDESASRDRILRELNQIKANLSSSDSAVFIFCGHGVQVPDDQQNEEADGLDEALVPSDAVPKKASTLILDDELTRIFESAGGPQWTVILDACHSATAARSLVFNPSGTRIRSLPVSLFVDMSAKSVLPSPETVPMAGIGLVDRPSAGGTRSLESRRTCVFAACQDEGIAGEDPATGHGYFTQHFLELFNSGKLEPRRSTYSEVARFAETVFEFPKDGAMVQQKSSADVPEPMKNLIFIPGGEERIPQASAGGVSIRLSSGGDNLYVGDLLQLTITSDRDGYLTVLNIDADGNQNCLYPNEKHQNHSIRANEPLEIPGSSDEFKLRIVDKDARGRPLRLGAERIVAYVTQSPWTPSWYDKVDAMGGLKSIDVEGLKAVRVESDREDSPPGDHVKAEVTFQTLPR